MAQEDEDLAALAGFTVAFFRADDELWKIFQEAKREGWDGARLLAAARNTGWFKRHNEARRQAALLRESDPAEYTRQLQAADAEVEQIARSLSLTLGNATRRELRDLAFIHGWSTAQIENYLRNTKSYRDRSESQREVALLQSENPAEYQRRLAEVRSSVSAISDRAGLGLSGRVRNEAARLALVNGWNENQILTYLAQSDQSAGGRVGDGQAVGLVAEAEQMARQLSADYGVRVNDKTITQMAVNYASGTWNDAALRDWFLDKARKTYAGIAPDLDAGLTVRDVAEQYIDSMGRILELNTGDLDVFDPTVRKALTGRDQDGKPAVQPLWQFENALRDDPRWNQTNNARESMMGVGYSVLKDMGVVW